MYLPSLTWSQAAQFLSTGPVVIQPLGSHEQHGAIGPLGTDFIIPEHFATDLEKLYPQQVALLPPLPYGVCPYHQAFAGTIDIGIPTLTSILESVVKSLIPTGARHFLFLNGHGGNDPAIDAACLCAWKMGGIGAKINWWTVARELNPAWGGGHGGAQEASVVESLHPTWVNHNLIKEEEIYSLSDAFPSVYGNAINYRGATIHIIRPTEEFTKTGTFGGLNDQSCHTNPQKGREIYQGVLDWMKAFIPDFKNIDPSLRRGKPTAL